MKWLYRFLLVIVLLSPVTEKSANPAVVVNELDFPNMDFTGDAKYRIIKIVDGDTICIERDGKSESVRLIGVDTPETVNPKKKRLKNLAKLQPVSFAICSLASPFTYDLILQCVIGTTACLPMYVAHQTDCLSI